MPCIRGENLLSLSPASKAASSCNTQYTQAIISAVNNNTLQRLVSLVFDDLCVIKKLSLRVVFFFLFLSNTLFLESE